MKPALRCELSCSHSGYLLLKDELFHTLLLKIRMALLFHMMLWIGNGYSAFSTAVRKFKLMLVSLWRGLHRGTRVHLCICLVLFV